LGCSDIWFGILAPHLAARHGSRALIDAYDNYETYHPMIPPLRRLWRQALRRADAVTAAGPQLADFMARSCGRSSVGIVPMAADPEFIPSDSDWCRRQVGLPVGPIMLGYMGAIDGRRGVDLLFRLWPELKSKLPGARLLLSGRRSKGIRVPEDTIWLGYRPPEQAPLILNGLDLAFVLNRPSRFGNYSYPSKLYEAMCCGVPAVAAALPGTAWILRDHPRLLAQPGSVEDFLDKAHFALGFDRYPYGKQADWTASAAKLDKILTQ
jgi:glycosyltransferase involved in cell wall biosynthesis